MGMTSSSLAKEYGCTPNTVIRTVKGMLSTDEYSELKESKAKDSKPREESISKKSKVNGSEKNKIILDNLKTESKDMGKVSQAVLDETHSKTLPLEDADDFRDEFLDAAVDVDTSKIQIDQEPNEFEELVPLVSDFGFEQRQQKVPLKNLVPGVLPEIIYMLVDKKIELEFKPLSEYPEWSFLPDSEKSRNAIFLYDNQRAAKRNCSRGQRVIKVPDSGVFILSKSFLLSKGITRLILEDSLISIETPE